MAKILSLVTMSFIYLGNNRVQETNQRYHSQKGNKFVRVLFKFIVDQRWIQYGTNKTSLGRFITRINDNGEYFVGAHVTRLNDFSATE